MPELTFDEVLHEYRLDNVVIPSVSELVGIYGADQDEPDEYLETVLDAAAERGTLLHAYIAHRLHGGEPNDFEIPSSYSGYLEAVDLFLSEHTFEPYCIELHMWGELNGLKYGATPDYIGGFDGLITNLDYKFVAVLAKTKVGAQLAAYDNAAFCKGIAIDRRIAVQFKKDGSYTLYEAGEEGAVDFGRAVDVYKAKRKKHPRGGIA